MLLTFLSYIFLLKLNKFLVCEKVLDNKPDSEFEWSHLSLQPGANLNFIRPQWPTGIANSLRVERNKLQSQRQVALWHFQLMFNTHQHFDLQLSIRSQC